MKNLYSIKYFVIFLVATLMLLVSSSKAAEAYVDVEAVRNCEVIGVYGTANPYLNLVKYRLVCPNCGYKDSVVYSMYVSMINRVGNSGVCYGGVHRCSAYHQEDLLYYFVISE